MINNNEITKSVNSLCNKEEHAVKTISVLEEKGYSINRNKIVKLNVIQMFKHCYDNAEMLTEKQIDNISDIAFNL